MRATATRMHRVGVISDTHGLLRPEALVALEGSDAIIHAGDVGNVEVLHALRQIAPVTAVRGNNDHGAWAERLPLEARATIGAARILVIHDVAALASDPSAASLDVVVFGHSHQPACERRDGVLYLNPGSAGPRRFRLPVCVAHLSIRGSAIDATIVPLDVEAVRTRRSTARPRTPA
jgi:uncharacterized protein